jgi:hypothetical protein
MFGYRNSTTGQAWSGRDYAAAAFDRADSGGQSIWQSARLARFTTTNSSAASDSIHDLRVRRYSVAAFGKVEVEAQVEVRGSKPFVLSQKLENGPTLIGIGWNEVGLSTK